MTIFSQRLADIDARIRAEQEAQQTTDNKAAYLSNTPENKLLENPAALADIRDYYARWEGKYFTDDKEMLEEFHDDWSWNTLNTMGIGGNWAEASNAGEEKGQHMARMASLFEKVPNLNSQGGFADHIGGASVAGNIGESLLLDPLNLVGFGAGGLMGKSAARAAAAAGQSGMKQGMLAAGKRGALVEGALNMPIAYGHDAMTQGFEQEVGLRDEYSTLQGAGAAALGGVGGGVLGGIMGAFAGAWGARIGAKEAQRLLDAGHTPESIPSMSQKQVDDFLKEADDPLSQKPSLGEKPDGSEYDRPAVWRKESKEREAKIAKNEEEGIFDPDLADDVHIVDQAIDRVNAALQAETDDATRNLLNDHLSKLSVLRARIEKAQSRIFEIEEQMKVTTNEIELVRLEKELRAVIEVQNQVNRLRLSMGDPTVAKVADEATPAPTPEEPVAKVADDTEAKPAVKVEEEDVVGEAVNTTEAAPEDVQPKSKGRPKTELSPEVIKFIREQGVDEKIIERAVAATTTPPRKRLLKNIARKHKLYETDEELNAANINDLNARVEELVARSKAEALPEVNETKPVDVPETAAEDAAIPVADVEATPSVKVTDEVDYGPTDSYDPALADMPSGEDYKFIDGLVKLMRETPAVHKKPAPEAAPAAKAEADTPPPPEPTAESPTPLSVEEVASTKLSDTGLPDSEFDHLSEVLALAGLKSTPSKLKALTIEELAIVGNNFTAQNHSISAMGADARINAFEVIERIKMQVAPNGILRNTQSRTDAINQVNKLFRSYGKAFTNDAVAFLNRLSGNDLNVGEDGLPIFTSPKMTMGRSDLKGDNYNFRGSINSINLGAANKNGVITPRLATFYHEVAHWMFDNVLTSAQRIEAVKIIRGKIYDDSNALNLDKVQEMTSIGKDVFQGYGVAKGTDGKGFRTNSDASIDELFAEQFALFAMRNHASPDSQSESLFKKMAVYIDYLYKRFILQQNVIDPDLERLFINIIPNEKQVRDRLINNVKQVNVSEASPQSQTGKAIRVRLSEVVEMNATIEDSIGSTSIISYMKDAGAMMYSLSSQRGKTKGFRQVQPLHKEMRSLSEEVYGTIREYYGETKGKQGGEQDWEAILSGEDDLSMSAEIELAEKLEHLWEKEGGMRDLMSRTDDQLRGQYYRHEQELIITPIAKDYMPALLSDPKVRDGWLIKLEYQKNKPKITHENIATYSVKARAKTAPRTMEQQAASDAYAMRKLPLDKLKEIAAGEGQDAADAATILLAKWKDAKPKFPKGYAPNPILKSAKTPELKDMLVDALVGEAAGDKSAGKMVRDIRWEMARRGGKKKIKNDSTISNTITLLSKKEEVIHWNGSEPDNKIPLNISAVGREFLQSFTHRDPIVQQSLRTVMTRFLNMMDMDTNSEFINTQFLSQADAMLEGLHIGKLGDPNAPIKRDMINEVDLTKPVFKRFLREGRKNVVALGSGDIEQITQGIRGMARLALRTNAIPSSNKSLILETYRLQPESVVSEIRGKLGGGTEWQEAERFFTDSFVHYLSGHFPSKENIFKGLTLDEAEQVVHVFDNVRDSVDYLTSGVINKKELVGVFDELAFSEPAAINAERVQVADAMRDTMLRSIDPSNKDSVIKSYLRYLEKANPLRLDRLNRFAKGLGLGKDGAVRILWHSSPNGAAFDRAGNPILRPSKNGQLGSGIYMSSDAELSFNVFGQRPTKDSVKAKIFEAAARNGITEGSAEHNKLLSLHQQLADAYDLGSVTSKKIIKGRDSVDEAERLVDLIDNPDDLHRIIKELESTSVMLEAREAVFEQNEAIITKIMEEMNDIAGVQFDPVLIPLVVRAERVADFSLNKSYTTSDPLLTSLLGRIRQIEAGDVHASDAQRVLMEGKEYGLTQSVLDVIRPQLEQGGGKVSGNALYQSFVTGIASSLGGSQSNIKPAQQFVDELLESLGFEAKVGSNRNRVQTKDDSGNLLKVEDRWFDEVVVFKSKNVKHLGADIFDEESSTLMHSSIEILDEAADAPNPNGKVLLAAINSEGPLNKKGWASTVNEMEEAGAPPTLTSALIAKAKGKPLTEGQAKALSQFGPKMFLSKGSDRLRSYGMNWLGDFIQPQHGTGFHERQNSELARKVVPIIQMLHKLPDAKGTVGRWASRNNPMHIKQQPSVKRIVKTLRRPAGHEAEKRLSPEEFEVYRAMRDLFHNEAVALKEAGVIMGHIDDYFPQIWNKEVLVRNKDEAVDEIARHLMRESVTERNADISPEQAVEKAQAIFNRLVDDEGVYMPPPTGGRRDATGDHIDYQRMLRLDKYPDSLRSLEKYLEDDLDGMMTKYFDLSTRRIEFARKFGTSSHGYFDYLFAVEHGVQGMAELMTTGKVHHRSLLLTNKQGDLERTELSRDLMTPVSGDPVEAMQLIKKAQEMAKNQGADAARDFLIGAHPRSTPTWEKRADAIAHALADFGGEVGQVPEQAYKFTQGLFNTTQRKPVSPQDTFFDMQNRTSKTLRSINAVTLLGWTTLTSLGDVALPLVRSGNFRAWANGIRKWSSDPIYRESIQKVGVAIENLTHERLTHLVGADSTKATNAFFNFTMLTPWTNMNREMAGAVFHQAIIAEQRQALTAPKTSIRYKTAMRFLNRYGLAEFGKEGAKDLANPQMLADSQAVRDGMIRFANESIFTPNSNDIPLWAQTPWGSIVFQLKSFPLMMQRLVLGEGGVMSEAVKANPYPLLYAMTIGAGFGMMSLGSKDVAQARGGEDEQSAAFRKRNLLKSLGFDKSVHGDEDDFAGWYLDGLIQMGGMGLLSNMVYDSAQQLDNGAYGQMRTMSTLFGPSVGLLNSGFNVMAGASEVVSDSLGGNTSNSKERQALREVASRVPVLGGVKAFREGAVNTGAGQPEGKAKSSSGWGGGFSDGFKGGF